MIIVRTDDLLIQAPHLAPWRPRVGIRPRLTGTTTEPDNPSNDH
jgi:hypothetical protein